MPQRDRYIPQDERIFDCRSKIQEQSKNTRLGQKPEVGEIWYIRIKDNTEISTMIVKDLTEKTVLLEHDRLASIAPRYALNDIEFIEKAK